MNFSVFEYLNTLIESGYDDPIERNPSNYTPETFNVSDNEVEDPLGGDEGVTDFDQFNFHPDAFE